MGTWKRATVVGAAVLPLAAAGAVLAGAGEAGALSMPTPTAAQLAALNAAAIAAATGAGDVAGALPATLPAGVHPDTVEPINTQFSVPPENGCEGTTMFGNFGGAAYGKVAISSGTSCGISVYVVADQSGTVVDGPTVATGTSTWAQSTVNPASVIGEVVAICDGSANCGDYEYTAF